MVCCWRGEMTWTLTIVMRAYAYAAHNKRAPPTSFHYLRNKAAKFTVPIADAHFRHLLWFRFGLPSPVSSSAGLPAMDQALDEATSLSTDVLQPLIRSCLQSLSETAEPSPLPTEVCKGLIAEPPDTTAPIGKSDPLTSSTHVLLGYPDYPLYKRLSKSTAVWMVTRRCPVLKLPEMYMLNEDDSLSDRTDRLEAAGRRITGAFSLWDHWSEDERRATVLEFLKSLGMRGVLDLLGVRKTLGTSDLLPPSRETLLATFTAPHSPNAKLTVGARALAKHCHRDDSLQWWGKCTGSEEGKNSHALGRVLTIMREAAWINIHSLPHDVKVVEMRTTEGYGVRWLYDGSEFRGFLEPQMADGHQLGWRH